MAHVVLLPHRAVLCAAKQRPDAVAPTALLFAEALAADSGGPGGMHKVAVLDMEQHSMSSSAQAACAGGAPTISGTGSIGYILVGGTGKGARVMVM